jgi:hypothetical protein
LLLAGALAAGCSDDGDGGSADTTTADTAEGDAADSAEPPEDTGGQDTSDPDADTSVPGDTAEPDGGDVTDVDAAGPTCPDEQTSCLDDDGLNDPALCAGEPGTECVEGCCVPVFACTADADCAPFVGDADMGCPDSRFECRCNTGTGACIQWTCNVAADCGGGEICTDGVCEPPPATEQLAARIVSAPGVVTDGAQIQLYAIAHLASDPAIVVEDAVFEWQSDAEGAATVSADGVVTGGSEAGPALIQARVVGGVADWSAPLLVTSFGDNPGSARVLVVDALTREPVDAYTLVELDGVETSGVATDGVFGIPDVGTADVHVLSSGHHYVSYFGVDLAQDSDIVVFLPRRFDVELDIDQNGDLLPEAQKFNGDGAVFSGKPLYDLYSKLGEIELGVTSIGVTDGLFEFDLPVILGPNVKRYWDPEAPAGIFDPEEQTELPGGISFALGFPVISSFWLAGPPGLQPMWTLGGRVAFNDEGIGLKISEIIDSVANGGDIDVQQIVATLLPLFRNFYSGVRMVEVGETPDFAAPPEFDNLLATPLSNRIQLEVDALPTLGAPEAWADAAFMIGGTMLQSGHFVPLGITAGTDKENVNAEADGILDGNPETAPLDPFDLYFSAAHGGIQGGGSTYAVAIVAAAIDDGSGAKPEGGSGIIVPFELPEAGATGPTPSYSAGPFLGIATNSVWDAESRTLSVTPMDGADFHRVILQAPESWEWHVYLPGGVDTVVVPELDEGDGVTDRAGLATRFVVNAFDLAETATWTGLLTPGGELLDALLRVVSRASYVNLKVQAP